MSAMRDLAWTWVALLGGLGWLPAARASETQQVKNPGWFEPLGLVGLDGKPLPPDALTNKVVLFANVASECGFTPQYDGLQQLWTEYRDRGLVVVGVPSNQFGGQEPGTAPEIQSFCRLRYGVDFPLLEKQDVKGPKRSALYRHLVESPVGRSSEVAWNFEKFLVSPDGIVLERWRSITGPRSPALVRAVEEALVRHAGS